MHTYVYGNREGGFGGCVDGLDGLGGGWEGGLVLDVG